MPLTSRRWGAIVLVAAAVLVAHLPGTHATAWHYFDDAARLLIGRGPDGEAQGLRLYADHPELQFGPLSIVVAVPFSLLGPRAGAYAAMVAASAAGIVAAALVLGTVARLRPMGPAVSPGAATMAALTLVVTWGDVAVRTAHLDDAVALLALAAAGRAVAGGSGRWAAVWLAVAAAAKPWAIVGAPLALVPAGPVVVRALRPALVAALAAATWAPFVVAEPGTLGVRGFGIANDPTSVLRALGIDDPTTPAWVRPTQLVGGVTLATIVVLARRWPAALLAGVAWRLMLEPGAHRYYTVGVVVTALLVELWHRPQRWPWATVVAAAALEVTALPGAPAPLRYLRLAVVVAALTAPWWARGFVSNPRSPPPDRVAAPEVPRSRGCIAPDN